MEDGRWEMEQWSFWLLMRACRVCWHMQAQAQERTRQALVGGFVTCGGSLFYFVVLVFLLFFFVLVVFCSCCF